MSRGIAVIARRLIAGTIAAAGIVLVAAGNAWAPFVLDALADLPMGSWLELIVPFFPLALIAAGALTWYARSKTP